MRDAVLVLLLVSVLALGSATVAAADTAGAASASAPARPPEVSPTATEFVVKLQPDGDARWRITVEYAFDEENEAAAFEAYARSYVDGEVDGPVSVALFRETAAAAENATGRDMSIRGIRRSSTIGEERGTLALTFVWTNFLEPAGPGEYVLGDALYTPENETWIPALGPRQTLVIRTPTGYAINTTSFPVLQQNRSVILNGPWSFREDGHLRISYTEATASITTTTTSPPPTTTTTTPPGESSSPWGLLIAALLVGAGAVGGWYVFARGASERPGDDEGGEAVAESPTEPADVGPEPPETTESEAEPEPESEPEPEPELLSDEERVVRLLERNGGRMRQADIVDETGWSDAKVSQLLSAMDEEDQVDKLRLGRENLISLPEYDHEE